MNLCVQYLWLALAAFKLSCVESQIQLETPEPRNNVGSCVLDNINLGSTTELSREGLIATSFIMFDGSPAPFVQVLSSRVVCESSGLFRDTVSSVSLIVNYLCQGFVCGDEVVNRTEQFQFDCQQDDVFSPPNIMNGDLRTIFPTGDFDTVLDDQCGLCIDPDSFTGAPADDDTHCSPCSPACNQGQQRCVGIDSDQCCNFYFNDTCVATCPGQLVGNGGGDNPSFGCVCESLELANGVIEFSDDRLVGSAATHTCNDGFELRDASGTATSSNVRTCSVEDGWSGSTLSCGLANGIFCFVASNCAASSPFTVSTIEDCCNNTVLPLGAAYTMDGTEGCFRCPVVFGFSESTFSAPERDELYSIDFGFFSGVASDLILLNFQLNLGTAGEDDIVLLAPPLTFRVDEPKIATISFRFERDNIAQEFDETFSVTFTGLDPDVDLVFGADVTEVLNGTIIDVDEVEVKLSENDYREFEDMGPFPVRVEKNMRLANPLTVSVTPLMIGSPQLVNFVPEGFSDEEDDPFSPMRANEMDYDPAVTSITFPADELDLSPTNMLPSPIAIVDDDINEADEQMFVVVLQVTSAVNLALVWNDERNFSVCIIEDNDPISIGFEFPFYEFKEPDTLTQINDVLIVKEDNRQSEQTFSVLVIVSNPLSPVLPATLQTASLPSGDFDYTLGAPDQTSVTYLFPPQFSSIVFEFSLNGGDDMTEGFEAFVASSGPSPGFITTYQTPIRNASAATQIGIIDDDAAVVGFISQFITTDESDMQVVILEIGVLSGSLQRDLVLNLELTDGSAILGSDYLQIADTSLVLDSVTTSISVAIQLVNDDVFELTENLFATLSFATDLIAGRNVTISPSMATITILDNDVVELGFDPASYMVDEEAGFVTINIVLFSGSSEQNKVVLVLTDDNMTMTQGVATAGVDYEPVATQLLFPANATMISFNITIFPDNITEGNEVFNVSLDIEDFVLIDDEPVQLSAQELSRINVVVNIATVTIIDDEDDVVTGDPFFTIPLYVPEAQLQAMNIEKLALCYEVHGESDKWFNLVTDECATVNGRFAYLSSSLNVIDNLGVKAVDVNGNCVNIRVDVHGCTAKVNGRKIGMNKRYSSGGVSVSRRKNRIRISLPNCNQLTLVMYAVCEINLPNQPGEMIKLVVSRGLNFEKRQAHGLIGQFWNAPVTLTQQQPRTGDVNKWYTVNITTGYTHSRSFGGFLYNLNWERKPQMCLYAGDMQGAATYRTDTGGVIQSTYKDYEVPGPLSEEGYSFGLFDKQKC